MKSNQAWLSRSAFPIVGLGASAGGLAAFTELLSAIPVASGMAFVVVQHLAPTHDSILAEALSRSIRLKVTTARDGMPIEPDNVYVIPPNFDLQLDKEALRLVPRDGARKTHLAIDFFFRSLAEQRGSLAIGVVLSGSGADGTEGLRAIKAEGGIALAQLPSTAKFPEMPDSAIRAGVVDAGSSIAELAATLVRLGRHPYLAGGELEVAGDDATRFEKILALVQARTGVDFSEYKRGTIERRAARRMVLRGQANLKGYLHVLKTDAPEAAALCEDVLIHVTSFFRDAPMFHTLQTEIVPRLLAARTKSAPLRAWVAGCSTGEEVYSLAISILEAVEEGKAQSVQIFGSDVSEHAVEKARAGIFSAAAVQDLNDEILRKYFTKIDQGYRINKQVRELCVFVRHDLARDPPFAHLDLVLCRNVLIYFGPALQKHVLATFHFCLKQPGFLVLGRSESIGAYGQFFTVADRENKIYARTASRSVLQFSPLAKAWPSFPLPALPAVLNLPRSAVDLNKQMDRLLLMRYAPAGVIVNDKLEVVQFRGHTGAYLQTPPGLPQSNVLKMAREGLLLPLTSALAAAKKRGRPVRRRAVEIGEPGAITVCDVVVIPLSPPPPGASGTLRAVIFEEIAAPRVRPKAAAQAKGPARALVTRLRRELQTTREYQQSLLDEHARASEDLGTANEELLSGNEELQSMNEELQTAKEELQSANEELTTVNDELHSGNRELNLVNGDLVNLLNTVEIPIIFVDAKRRIRRFTPQAHSIFNVLTSDVGRPIDDIKPKVEVPDLDQQIASSIANVTVRESQVQDQLGRWYRMQIRPYQTSEGSVSGAILSLVDIDVLKRHVDQAEWSRDYAASVVDAVAVPLVVLDGRAQVISANESFYESFALSPVDTENRALFALAGGAWDLPALRKGLEALFGGEGPFQPLEVEGIFPRLGRATLSLSARAVRFRDSNALVLLAIEDVSLRKEADRERVRLLAEAQQARESAEQANLTKDAFLATVSHELRTPLSTMMMNAQLLRHPDLGSARIHAASEAIERSARAQSRMIEDLLDVSRIVTGKLSLDLRRLSLVDLIAAALEAVALQAERKKLRLEAKLEAPDGRVMGDSLRLQQVISNLVTNSIKFTPAGGTITVSLCEEGEQVCVRVRDTGSGISAQFLPFVFERFSQQENSSVRQYGGLGLGLSIVRDIVEMHGGTVRAESEGPGKGASFTVSLPRLSAAAEAAATAEAPQHS